MTQLAEVRAPLVTRSIHTDSLIEPQKTPSAVTLHPLTVLGLAMTLGLATGLVELVMHVVRRQFINPSSFGALQLNASAYWMVPVSNLFIFGACGLLVAAAVALWRSHKVSAAGAFGLFFVSALAVMFTFRGLTLFASSVFALGLSYRLTKGILAEPRRAGRIVRRALPALIGVAVILTCLDPAARNSTRGGWFPHPAEPPTSCSSCLTRFAPKA